MCRFCNVKVKTRSTQLSFHPILCPLLSRFSWLNFLTKHSPNWLQVGFWRSDGSRTNGEMGEEEKEEEKEEVAMGAKMAVLFEYRSTKSLQGLCSIQSSLSCDKDSTVNARKVSSTYAHSFIPLSFIH